MMELAHFLNYGTVALTLSITAMGVSIGQGKAGSHALQAINIQPQAQTEITKMIMIGMAIMETAAVLSAAFTILLLFDQTIEQGILFPSIARLGIALSLCFSGITLGIVSAWPTAKACYAVARQPFFSQKILNLLLITQSLLQTPIIFCFITCWLIKTQAAQTDSFIESVRLISSGLVIGLGSVGPIIGLALFAESALEGTGINRKAYPKIVTLTFLSEAMIETPILFAFIISLVMLFTPTLPSDTIVRAATIFSAALCTGLCTLIPSISSGRIASSAGREVALRPDSYSALTRTSMFAQALIDTFVIYGALVSLLMLLIVR
jgi:F-type H+-transporting ATPase subunit c